MSTWQNIPDEDVELDGADINVLINADEYGNNYVILNVAHIEKLLKINTPNKDKDK